MTNSEIIERTSNALMEAGILKPIKQIEVQTENGTKLMDIPEPIHTFQGWRELGYTVRKGEHAVAKFPIWKHTVKKAKQEGEHDISKMFMQTAAWFTAAQVDKM